MRTFIMPGKPYPVSSKIEEKENNGNKIFDYEMLYVECKRCGKPIIWEAGRTTALLQQSNLKPDTIDEHCLIISEGCSECMPDKQDYRLAIIRLAEASPSDPFVTGKPSSEM